MLDQQLTLGVSLQDSARFDNYLPGPNREVVAQLQSVLTATTPVQLYCWGAAGLGKTHLLQAICNASSGAGHSAVYIPLDQSTDLHPAILDGLDEQRVVCLDDLDRVAGQADWEEALFHCYNAVRQRGGSLVVSADAAPSRLSLKLADLRSRLESGLIYNLQALDDEQRLQALQLRARSRGFELPEDTGQYLIRRVPRDMVALFRLLDKLDRASLSAQRRLTIPFVKTIL